MSKSKLDVGLMALGFTGACVLLACAGARHEWETAVAWALVAFLNVQLLGLYTKRWRWHD